MKLKRIIFSLFLIYSFSYAEISKEYNGNKVASPENILNEVPYNSEGKYYQLIGKVLQRIDINSMLVLGTEHISKVPKEAIIYVEGIPKGTSIAKDTLIDIIVKGDGEYRYTNADGVSKVVVKAIWQNNEVYNDSSTKQIDEKIENSIIKKQYNENGILLEIEYPAKIIPNSYVDFKITVINNLPYIDTKGGITIGFPQYKSLDIIKNNSTLVTKSYPSKSKLWNGNIKQTISSEYFMIEGWETDWKQSQIKTMNFSVFINDSSELKNINIFVRSILISNKIEYVNPIDGIEGQQGYKNVNISIPLIRD